MTEALWSPASGRLQAPGQQAMLADIPVSATTGCAMPRSPLEYGASRHPEVKAYRARAVAPEWVWAVCLGVMRCSRRQIRPAQRDLYLHGRILEVSRAAQQSERGRLIGAQLTVGSCRACRRFRTASGVQCSCRAFIASPRIASTLERCGGSRWDGGGAGTPARWRPPVALCARWRALRWRASACSTQKA